jgi:hypothetical protein
VQSFSSIEAGEPSLKRAKPTTGKYQRRTPRTPNFQTPFPAEVPRTNLTRGQQHASHIACIDRCEADTGAVRPESIDVRPTEEGVASTQSYILKHLIVGYLYKSLRFALPVRSRQDNAHLGVTRIDRCETDTGVHRHVQDAWSRRRNRTVLIACTRSGGQLLEIVDYVKIAGSSETAVLSQSLKNHGLLGNCWPAIHSGKIAKSNFICPHTVH